jgi:hypothetical protein
VSALFVEVLYSRSGLFGEFFPKRGGYVAGLRGAPEEGCGETPEAAVADLTEKLQALVATEDPEGRLVVPERSHEDHPVLGEVARAVRCGTLHDDLRAAASEPVLDPVDEPRRPGSE